MAEHEEQVLISDQLARSSAEVEDPTSIDEVLTMLDQLDLGRPIHLEIKPPTEEDSFARAGLSKTAVTKTGGIPSIQIGYALPSQPDLLRSVLILNNGDIFVLEPLDNEPDTLTHFKKNFSPNPAPFLCGLNTYPTTDYLSIALAERTPPFSSKTVLRNDTTAAIPAVQEELKRTIYCSKTLKREREEAKFRTGEYLLGLVAGNRGENLPETVKSHSSTDILY